MLKSLLLSICLSVSCASLHAVTQIGVIQTGSRPVALALNPVTHRLYTANDLDKTVAVVDTARNTVVATIPVSYSIGLAADVAANLIYVNSDAGVFVIDGNTNTVVTTIATGSGVGGIAVDSNLHQVYAANAADHTISVIDSTLNEVVATLPVGAIPMGVAVDQKSGYAFVTTELPGLVAVIDGHSNNLKATITPPGPSPLMNGIAVDGRLRRVYVTDNNNGNLDEIDIPTLTVTRSTTGFASSHGVSVNLGSHRISVLNFIFGGGEISVVDPRTLLFTVGYDIPTLSYAIVVDSSSGITYVGGQGGVYVLGP